MKASEQSLMNRILQSFPEHTTTLGNAKIDSRLAVSTNLQFKTLALTRSSVCLPTTDNLHEFEITYAPLTKTLLFSEISLLLVQATSHLGLSDRLFNVMQSFSLVLRPKIQATASHSAVHSKYPKAAIR